MRTPKHTIIATQEHSSMVSTWTEYLVLERHAKSKSWRLFVGKYEALAGCWDYHDENTGDFKLPKTISGKRVVDVEDEWVVGGPLQAWEHPEISFDAINEDVVAYVNEYWSNSNQALAELDRIVNKLGERTLIRAFDGEGRRFNLWLDVSSTKPILGLRRAFTAPKEQPLIFSANATNSRKFLNAIRSAWYLMLRRDVTEKEVFDISWQVRDQLPALAKNMKPMFKKMLGERLTKNGEVVNVGSDPSALPKVLYAMKNVVIAEGQIDDRLNDHPLPVFKLYNRFGGWPIGYLGWIENNRFHGSSCYGPNDFPFSATTLEDFAYAAWNEEKYTMALY